MQPVIWKPPIEWVWHTAGEKVFTDRPRPHPDAALEKRMRRKVLPPEQSKRDDMALCNVSWCMEKG